MENPNNRMVAAGRLEKAVELSHEVMNEPFYSGIFSDEMADSVPACPTIETSLAVGSGQTARFAAWHKD